MKTHPLHLYNAMVWVPWAWVAGEVLAAVAVMMWVLRRVARRQKPRHNRAHLAAAGSFPCCRCGG